MGESAEPAVPLPINVVTNARNVEKERNECGGGAHRHRPLKYDERGFPSTREPTRKEIS